MMSKFNLYNLFIALVYWIYLVILNGLDFGRRVALFARKDILGGTIFFGGWIILDFYFRLCCFCFCFCFSFSVFVACCLLLCCICFSFCLCIYFVLVRFWVFLLLVLHILLKVLVFSCLIFLLLSDYNYKMRPLCPWTQDTIFFYEGPQNSMNRRAQNFYMRLRPPKNMNTRFQKKEPKATNIQGT